MKLSSRFLGQAIKAAGVGAALMLSVSAGYAQSGPFAGFDGNWSGAGTVSLSNGTTENIRCRADYKVNANGLGLKQNLHCASDSYKFDLSSNVTSQGDRISGNWSEKSRNIFGNLQGTAGSGQIDVFVEASGFAANLNLRTNGNKQGVGTAMVYPTLLAAIADHAHPLWRASSLGVYRFWRDLGYAIGALLSGLIADALSVGAAIHVVAAITLASGVVSFAIMRDVRR